jgi:predicted dehydrogenase
VRLGFLGLGWIGRNRMEAIAKSAPAEIAAIADTAPALAAQAKELARDATVLSSLDEMLEAELGLDGVVIATPSALHAQQAMQALEHGLAVFCQKPLARTYRETRTVLAAAKWADRLLGVDLSYRHLAASKLLFELVHAGDLGRIYAADLAFHNAYGPDKAWFYDPALSGGGCVIDLGIHLVDLALWVLGFPRIEQVTSRLFAQGNAWAPGSSIVEDYAVARLDIENETTIQMACSWKLPVGQDARIEAHFYGTKGGAALRNVNGSFYDFTLERFRGTSREVLASPPDLWGGRAAVEWVRRLAVDRSFDPGMERLAQVAWALDAVYGREIIAPL